MTKKQTTILILILPFFYVHRNIGLWKNNEPARKIISMNKAKRVVVFVINNSEDNADRYYIGPNQFNK